MKLYHLYRHVWHMYFLCETLWFLLQFGMHKLRAPCLQHFTKMFTDRKVDGAGGGKYLPVRPLSALSIFLQRDASLYLNCALYEVSLALFSYWLQMSSSLVRAIIRGLSKKSCDRCHSLLQSLYAGFSLRWCTARVLSLEASCEYPAVETSDKDFRYICDIEWTRF